MKSSTTISTKSQSTQCPALSSHNQKPQQANASIYCNHIPRTIRPKRVQSKLRSSSRTRFVFYPFHRLSLHAVAAYTQTAQTHAVFYFWCGNSSIKLFTRAEPSLLHAYAASSKTYFVPVVLVSRGLPGGHPLRVRRVREARRPVEEMAAHPLSCLRSAALLGVKRLLPLCDRCRGCWRLTPTPTHERRRVSLFAQSASPVRKINIIA